MRYWSSLGFCVGLLAALLSACSTKELLATTPAAFASPQNRPPVDGAQPINASGDLNILYVTDRAPASDPRTTALSYGSERSRTMSFGSIGIRIGRIRAAARET
jgi:esterase/lipase superfamily enzyme